MLLVTSGNHRRERHAELAAPVTVTQIWGAEVSGHDSVHGPGLEVAARRRVCALSPVRL